MATDKKADDAIAAVKVEVAPESPEASQHPAAAPAPKDDAAHENGEPEGVTRDSELRRIRRVLAGILVLLVLAMMYFASAVFTPLVAALLLSFLLKPVVRRLEKVGISPPVSAMLIMGGLFVGMILGIGAASDSMQRWLESLPEAAQQLETKFRDLGARVRQVNRATEKLGEIASGSGPVDAAEANGAATPGAADPEPGEPEPPQPVPVQLHGGAMPTVVLSTTATIIAGLTITLVLSYFILASGDLLLRQLVQVLPSLPEKREAVEAWRDLEKHVSGYLITVTVINIGLGLVSWGMLWLFGVPYAMWWGVCAAVLNFVPYIGPLVVTVAIFLAGVIAFSSASEAILPAATFVGIQTIEGYFVTPMVVGRRLSLNPLVLFIWLVFWAWMWGVVGSLLAVPMLICFKIVCDHVVALEPLSNLLSGYVRRAGEGREEEAAAE